MKKPRPTPPQPVASLADLKPRPAPTGRVRLSAAPTAPVQPDPPRTLTTDMRLYIVTKVNDIQTVHALVRARTRDEAVEAAGFERLGAEGTVQEVLLEGEQECVWDCVIQNVEEDEFFDPGD